MAFKTEWRVAKRVLYLHLYGDITEDVYHINNTVSALLKQGKSPIHPVVNLNNLESFPTSMSHYRQMLGFMQNAALGRVVVFGEDDVVLRFFSHVVGQISPARVSLCDTEQRALRFLQSVDATVKPEHVINTGDV